jgi:hypothetical protein
MESAGVTPEGLGLQLMNEKEVKAAEGGRKEGTWNCLSAKSCKFRKDSFPEF